MWIALSGFAINTAFNYVLIGRYGILGSAVATTVTSFVIMLVMLYFISKNFAVSIELKSLLKIITASVVLLLCTFFLPTSVALFLLSSLIASGIYFAVLYLLKEISAADLTLIRSLATRKKKD